MIRTTIRRLSVPVLAALAAALMAAGLAAAPASAAPLRPEHFTVLIDLANPGGIVDMNGPVAGFAGTDTTISPVRDVFDFTGPARSVNVRHSPVGNTNPVINPVTCAARQTLFGSWRFAGGTGRFRFATGFGGFRLTSLLIVHRLRSGRCDLNPNHQPAFFRVRVTGDGLAARR